MSTQTKIPIIGLMAKYEAALTGMGYSYTTRLLFLKRADLIIQRHENQGLEYLDQAVITSYLQEIDERYFRGRMQKRHYTSTIREIQRFVDYAYSGRSRLPNPRQGCRQKLSTGFEKIAEGFISGDFHPNTRCDIRWTTYKYFSWLEKQGFKDLDGVGALHLQKFLLDCSERYAPSSIRNGSL